MENSNLKLKNKMICGKYKGEMKDKNVYLKKAKYWNFLVPLSKRCLESFALSNFNSSKLFCLIFCIEWDWMTIKGKKDGGRNIGGRKIGTF